MVFVFLRFCLIPMSDTGSRILNFLIYEEPMADKLIVINLLYFSIEFFIILIVFNFFAMEIRKFRRIHFL